MKIQRIYIDTSVIGGCFDPEFAPWSNGLMKDFRLGNFAPVISDVVLAEIEPAPARVHKLFARLLELDPQFVRIDEGVRELAEVYRQRHILPEAYHNDALHIALATVAGVDILVSWNFKHIVHYEKIRQFNAVNIELGHKSVEIYSPREVTNYGNEAY